MTFWDYLRKYPPAAVRLFARRRDQGRVIAITDEEIAITAGLTLARVLDIGRMRAWTRVELGEMQAFCRACRFDPLDWKDRNRATAYLRRGRAFRFLRQSPQFASRVAPLVASFNTAAR